MSSSSYESVFCEGSFKDQVVLITGGGSGIGRCCAHELSSLGAKVALVGRNIDKLNITKKEIINNGGVVESYSCDIRDEEAVKGVVSQVLNDFGKINHLVNNAGGQYATALEKISKKGWDAVISSNLTGGFLMARECYLQWMSDNGGAIVNMAADMWNGMPDMAHSGASRAGMVNLTMTAALEWGRSNVRVNAVAPGLVFSSGVDTYPPEIQERLAKFKYDVPLGRTGTEAEVSSAIVFLLSEGAAYISGTTINIDGAFAMASPNYTLRERKVEPVAYDGFHLSVAPKLLEK